MITIVTKSPIFFKTVTVLTAEMWRTLFHIKIKIIYSIQFCNKVNDKPQIGNCDNLVCLGNCISVVQQGDFKIALHLVSHATTRFPRQIG